MGQIIRIQFWTIIIIGLLFNDQTLAQSCRKDGIVLQHQHRKVVSNEINSLNQVISIHNLSGRAIVGTVAKKGRSKSDESCINSTKVCAKLYRDARKKGYSEFRRSKAFACSADYIVGVSKTTVSAQTKKWKKPTNDSLIKAQRYVIDSTGLTKAWQIGRNAGQSIVAVIDTGADYTHPDLAGNVIAGKNFSLGKNTDDPMDDNGHGTHVAGTIAAKGNNRMGVAGIAWNAKIFPIKFLDQNGSGYLSDAIRAVNYMIFAKQTLGLDIRISNNSWGGGSYSAAMHQAIVDANNAGILFVAAAGNESNDNDYFQTYPASYDVPNVISVAAYDKDLMLSYFSNYGSKKVHIAAPGTRIASTYPGGAYVYLSGTSMAAPHVSGAIALMTALRSNLSIQQLKNRLLNTSKYNSELRGYVKDGAQLEVTNYLRARTSQSLNGIRQARTKAKAKKRKTSFHK